MLVENILSHKPGVLTMAQRNTYFEKGCVSLPDFVPASWTSRLRGAVEDLVEKSRSVMRTNEWFVLYDGHSADMPCINRVTSPQDLSADIWEFFAHEMMTDLAADVVGPDVKFHHGKLNIKAGNTKGFPWHQDICGWPHTDFSPVTIGIYLEGCDTLDQGPLSFIAGSNHGPIYGTYEELEDSAAWAAPIGLVEEPLGGPGTVVLLNCRTLHGSSRNRTNKRRPLLLPVYTSADSFPYTPLPFESRHSGTIVRGSAARFASFDTRPCHVPPNSVKTR